SRSRTTRVTTAGIPCGSGIAADRRSSASGSQPNASDRAHAVRSKGFSSIQNDSALAQGHLRLRWELFSAAQHRSRRQVTSANVPKPCRHGRSETKRLTPRSTRGSGKLEDRAMFTSDDVQKRNAFAACAAFRIEGLEASLDHAREIAVRDELGAVGHYIEEAQGY